MRCYTPVTLNGTKGYFDLVVKRQPKGLMTNYLFGLHIGDHMEFRKIVSKMRYTPNRWKEVGLICGGTGLTPMLQVLRYALESCSEDKTKFHLLFCNRTENHIFLKGLLNQLAKTYPKRLVVHYSVDFALRPEAWEGFIGYPTTETLRRTMPPPCEKNLIMVCGPDQLLWHVVGTPTRVLKTLSGGKRIQPMAIDLPNYVKVGGLLDKIGHDMEQVYCF